MHFCSLLTSLRPFWSASALLSLPAVAALAHPLRLSRPLGPWLIQRLRITPSFIGALQTTSSFRVVSATRSTSVVVGLLRIRLCLFLPRYIAGFFPPLFVAGIRAFYVAGIWLLLLSPSLVGLVISPPQVWHVEVA
jgi:hypothetical protein